MSVDVNVNTTETNVNINASTVVETIDITATVQQDVVEIEVFPNVTVVNVTKKSGEDGQDGQDLTLEDFSVAPEASTLNDTDRFLIEQGGEWKSITKENLKIEINKEEILFSVRKIGIINKAFRLRRSSDNNEQDIYFDVNGNISDDSLCENNQTFGVWRGASTLLVIVWYNQSDLSGKYDLLSYTGLFPSYSVDSNEIIFLGSKMNLRNYFDFRTQKTNINVHKIITSIYPFAETYAFIEDYNIPNLGLFVRKQGNNNGTYGLRNYVSTSAYAVININQTLHLLTLYGNIGGENLDGINTTSVLLNSIQIAIDKDRDQMQGEKLRVLLGGLANNHSVNRKEIRYYNYIPSNLSAIESEIKTFFGI